MEQDSSAVISEVDLRVAQKKAQRTLQVHELENPLLESLLTYYEAAVSNAVPPLAALEASSGVLRNGYTPRSGSSTSLDAFLLEVDDSVAGEAIAGLYERVKEQNASAIPVDFAGRLYERTPLVRTLPSLIGVESATQKLREAVNRLFLYNPLTRTHFEREKDEAGVLLHGPPGTGKSSLCEYAYVHAQNLSQKSGLPFTLEVFESHEYSMWQGESEKALQKKFASLTNPQGVGLLVLEEVDMLFASREDSGAGVGVKTTNTLMQNLSGFSASRYSNFLVIGTSNLPHKIDHGMKRRLPTRVHVPLYDSLSQYRLLSEHVLSWPSSEVHEYLASTGFTNRLSASEMTSMCNFVHSVRCGPVDESIFSLPLHQREAARRAQYKDLSLQEVQSALRSYEF
ncbi:MAG: ATP-binding protein [Candidatus Woesearchaeota archaeon]